MKHTRLFVLAYLVIAVVFLPCDFTWITLSTASLYQPVLKAHMAGQIDWLAAGLFYLTYFVGVVAFVVRPAENRRWTQTFMMGVLFGVVSYATYDLTNQAILSGWTWKLSCFDMAWGGCVTAVSSSIARLAVNKMARGQPRYV